MNPVAEVAEGLIAPRLICRGEGGVALCGARCSSCGRLSFPAATICDVCHSKELAAHTFGRTGTLYSYAVVHVAPRVWKVPYILGYIDLPEGIRVLAHVAAQPSELQIGMSLVVAVDEVGRDDAGQVIRTYVFRPLSKEAER